MTNFTTPKSLILTGGILALMGPISVSAKSGSNKVDLVISENSSNCTFITPLTLVNLNIPTSLLTPELNEELIHVEKVIVCFDHIGIVTNIIPFTQTAGIENL